MKEQAMRKSILTVFAALSVTGLTAAPAIAAEAATVTVPYADLNLASPAGAAALDQRIDTAVAAVCEKPALRDLKAMVAWEECKAAAKAGALEQLSILDSYATLALAT
jgi:UrcA family protein